MTGKYQIPNIKYQISKVVIAAGVIFLASLAADARVGLVTVPRRDAVQVTIYNSADLTLVREQRLLTLAKGRNKLEFSWAGTLIDPTSIQFEAKTHADKVEVIDVSFPAQAPNALVWNVESEQEGEVLVEISYFTSGLTWSADYEGLVDAAGKRMKIASFVKVTNRSGEEYDGAQVRLVVGKIHLVENIAELANRAGRPVPAPVQSRARAMMRRPSAAAPAPAMGMLMAESAGPPEIIREGLSEYFLYTVAGVHAVPDQWSVRWPNFAKDNVEIENFYRYEQGRYNQPQRFVRLRNDKPHNLGEEPLPDGEVLIYQSRENNTRYFFGRSLSKYIPIGETWEIDLGADPEVVVKPTLARWAVTDVEFHDNSEPSGWDVKEDWTIEILNSRNQPISIEADQNFSGDFAFASEASHEKYDLDSIRFKRTLQPQSSEVLSYSITTRKGTRARR